MLGGTVRIIVLAGHIVVVIFQEWLYTYIHTCEQIRYQFEPSLSTNR